MRCFDALNPPHALNMSLTSQDQHGRRSRILLSHHKSPTRAENPRPPKHRHISSRYDTMTHNTFPPPPPPSFPGHGTDTTCPRHLTTSPSPSLPPPRCLTRRQLVPHTQTAKLQTLKRQRPDIREWRLDATFAPARLEFEFEFCSYDTHIHTHIHTHTHTYTHTHRRI
jgi:hypothetical protein